MRQTAARCSPTLDRVSLRVGAGAAPARAWARARWSSPAAVDTTLARSPPSRAARPRRGEALGEARVRRRRRQGRRRRARRRVARRQGARGAAAGAVGVVVVNDDAARPDDAGGVGAARDAHVGGGGRARALEASRLAFAPVAGLPTVGLAVVGGRRLALRAASGTTR